MLLIIYRGWLADVYVIILFCIQKKKKNQIRMGLFFFCFFFMEKFIKRICFKQTHLLSGLVGLLLAGIMGCFLAVYVI